MNYTQTEWKKGDVITDVLLNKLENAVEELGRSVPEAETLATDSKDGLLAREDFSKLTKITGDKQLTPLSIDASLADVVNKVNEIIGILKASGLAGSEKKTGLWGTSPWNFDTDSGVLTIEAGELSGYSDSPWYRKDEFKVDALLIKEIVLAGDVIAPVSTRYLFGGGTTAVQLQNLIKITNLGRLNTTQTTDMSQTFYTMSASVLAEIDISEWDASVVTDTYSMFKGIKLQRLTLGDTFKFVGRNAALGAPVALRDGDILTGNWIREDGESSSYSPTDFMTNYGTGDLRAGAYVAEVKGPNDLTKEQLKSILDEKKVSYKSNDTKANLIKMIERAE